MSDRSFMKRERSSDTALSHHSESTEGLESAEEAHPQDLVADVKEEWKLLWRDRFDDRVRAEGIANQEYPLLFVKRGRVIVATRDFKPVDFKEILCRHEILDVDRFVAPHPSVGGWGKFARTVLNKQKRRRRWREPSPHRTPKKPLQQKKGGRGWLHYRMTR